MKIRNKELERDGDEPWSSGLRRRLATERLWVRVLEPDARWNNAKLAIALKKRNKGFQMEHSNFFEDVENENWTSR